MIFNLKKILTAYLDDSENFLLDENIANISRDNVNYVIDSKNIVILFELFLYF